MKRLFVLLLCGVCLVASLSSCRKESTSVDLNNIVGTWLSDTDQLQSYVFTNSGVCYTYDNYVSSENKPVKGTFTFDGETLNASLGTRSVKGTVTFNLPKMTVVTSTGTETFTQIIPKYSVEELEKMLK